MWKRLPAVLLFSFSTGFLCAQKVLYSPFIGNQPETRFEVIGKAGDYYWVQKSRKRSRTKDALEPWTNDKELSLEVYDARMNLVRSIPSSISTTLVKEYFVAGKQNLDQLLFLPGEQKINVILNRYLADGSMIQSVDTLASFPMRMKCEDFLLIRSQDKSKVLLLGFESVSESPPILHAMLFDGNWRMITRTVYSDNNISKPMVQYDRVDYAVEDY
ncbi:MAG TPA: hypothetical protein VFP87_02295, partial [Chitinophagaceae bacterium]|nr:hypothetical protein [Chitinophagaceae bacterium]